MSEQGNEFEQDVEGHRVAAIEGEDDTEGHRNRPDRNRPDFASGAERNRPDLREDDDVEGHRAVMLDNDDDDVEGHRIIGSNVQPPRDTDLGGSER